MGLRSQAPFTYCQGATGQTQAVGPSQGTGSLTLVQNSIGRLVSREELLGQVLVALGKALHLGQAALRAMAGWLGSWVMLRYAALPELFLNDQRLLQQLVGVR